MHQIIYGDGEWWCIFCIFNISLNFKILCHVRGWPAISPVPCRRAVSIVGGMGMRSAGTRGVWAPRCLFVLTSQAV